MNKRYWSARIVNIAPYVPGEQPKNRRYIKLNTNENPYPPSPKALAAARAAASEELRLYPDPDASALRGAAASFYGIRPTQVFVGNGSDEVLACCFLAFTDAQTPAVFPDITYSFYPVYALLFGTKTRIPPLREDFSMPVEELCRNDGTVLLTNPNAPTSLALSRAQVEDIVRANPDHVVIVDEAYVDFGAESAMPLLARYDNLLIVQTLSKSRSLAGLRCGLALGSESLIAAMDAVKNSFNSYTLDRVAIAAATASIEDRAYFETTCQAVIRTRDAAAARLRALGCTVLPSAANFLFVSPPDGNAAALFAALREQGILVRYFAKPRIDRFLRISVGTEEEMQTLTDAVARLI